MESSSPDSANPGGLQGLLQRSGHPTAIIFHYAFKACALISYLFLGIFISNTVVIFIITLLFCCADFWTVQNITGRLLVALRWRNVVNEDGTESWKFDSLDQKHENNRIDSWGFWVGLYGYVAFWALFLLGGIITLSPFKVSFNQIIECLVFLLLAGVNLYGYTMCNRDHLKKIQGAFSVGSALGKFNFGAQAKV